MPGTSNASTPTTLVVDYVARFPNVADEALRHQIVQENPGYDTPRGRARILEAVQREQYKTRKGVQPQNPLEGLTPEHIRHLLSLLPPGMLPELPGKSAEEAGWPAPYVGGNPDNVLVVGDLHAPFIREGYLEFCRAEQERLDCGRVVFIGDIADNHAISFHETDPDGMSAGGEHEAAKEQLRKAFFMFPEVDSLLGNHCLLIARKARAAGLSQRHVRSVGEIFGAPATWKFHDEIEIHGILYSHGGSGGNAMRMAMH